MVGQCSCGLFHSQSDSLCGFSASPAMPAYYHKVSCSSIDEAAAWSTGMYSSHPYSSQSSSVDCTLSLGTPSTRLGLLGNTAADMDGHHQHQQQQKQATMSMSPGSSCFSSFCWDFLHTNKHTTSKTTSTANNNGSSCFDPPSVLLARRCANCDTTSTPLWRNGPMGPKSLCNACGIRFKKEERRANAVAAASTNGAAIASGLFVDGQQNSTTSDTWVQRTTQKLPCLSPSVAHEFRFIDDNRQSDTGISFLSWRLNVTDRPAALVHDFTR